MVWTEGGGNFPRDCVSKHYSMNHYCIVRCPWFLYSALPPPLVSWSGADINHDEEKKVGQLIKTLVTCPTLVNHEYLRYW